MKRIIVAALLLALPTGLRGNDTIAETAAGGLVLSRSADIDMASEDLFVSPRLVRVRYVFRNRSPRPIRATVAFPMPDQDFQAAHYGDVGFPSDFHTLVEGKAVAMQVERRAFVKGREVTDVLKALKLPVAGADIDKALDALPPAERARLVRLGIASSDEYDVGRGMERHLVPAWTARERWYWEQVFPAGRDLSVEHRYVPGTGGSVGSPVAFPPGTADAERRRMIADYCIDSDFLAAAKARSQNGRKLVRDMRLTHILTTGANWRAPIADFRLVVDKWLPGNLVSFCGEGVRKISPTRFEMRRTNWRPDRDLKVLILGEAGQPA